MKKFSPYAILLLAGIALALVSFRLLALFEADAVIASTTLEQQGSSFSAAIAYIAIRYWAIFALSMGVGFIAVRKVRCSSIPLVTLLALPWLIGVGVVSTAECIQAGEAAACWLVYGPGYLLVSALVVLPVGVLVALAILTVRSENRRAA